MQRAIAAAVTLASLAIAAPPLVPSVAAPGFWHATLIEDFDGPALNTTLWHPRINESHCEPCELELYVGSALSMSNATLVITTARQRAFGPGGKLFNFTSGWVDTKGSFSQQFGIFEVRAKLPAQAATGAWPAHWLLPASADVCWPVGGEVDIMEAISNPALDQVYGSYRWGTACGGDRQVLPGAAYPPLGSPPVDWSGTFHTFAVWWNASALSFFVDGEHYETKTAAQVDLPPGPMYLILNTAVAPFLPPGEAAQYPAWHTVDWVQVWQEGQ